MAYTIRIIANPVRIARLRILAGPYAFFPILLVATSITLLALFFLPKLYVAATVGAVIASVGVVYLVASTLHGRVDGVLLIWLLLSPLGYYFLSFPSERPIFTFDRFVILVLTVAALFVSQSGATSVPAELKRAGLAWALFILFAFTSLIGVWADVGLGGTRVIIDAFIFPALLALFVIRVFDAQRNVRTIHTLVGLTAMYCAAIGLYELLTNTDVLAIPDDTFYSAEQTGTFARVNGPFVANHCLGAIGAILLFLLLFLRAVMPEPVSSGRIWFHRLAICGAITMALLPQFRSLWIGLAFVILLELYRNRKIKARLYIGIMILLITLAMVALPALLPTFFETRVVDLSNAYGRIAQQQQTWELFASHPLNGVGFWNFIEASQRVSNTVFLNVESLNSAHNSLGSILAETGIAGCLPFIAANVLWFVAFVRLRNSGLPVAGLAYRFFLYICICYWAMGLTLTSAYEHDLNLWYMFACAIMYKLALTELGHVPSIGHVR
jgi:O-antigen ligase